MSDVHSISRRPSEMIFQPGEYVVTSSPPSTDKDTRCRATSAEHLGIISMSFNYIHDVCMQ